jgi:hypothetical protein
MAGLNPIFLIGAIGLGVVAFQAFGGKGGAGGALTQAHYDLVLTSGDLSPNIRSYEQFLDAYNNSLALFNQEHPHLVGLAGT